jgi:hypothetical protein
MIESGPGYAHGRVAAFHSVEGGKAATPRSVSMLAAWASRELRRSSHPTDRFES